jgi:bacteriocin-like protein
MPQKAKSAQKRVQVKDLPKKEKKLSEDELQKVKGGDSGQQGKVILWVRDVTQDTNPGK